MALARIDDLHVEKWILVVHIYFLSTEFVTIHIGTCPQWHSQYNSPNSHTLGPMNLPVGYFYNVGGNTAEEYTNFMLSPWLDLNPGSQCCKTTMLQILRNLYVWANSKQEK